MKNEMDFVQYMGANLTKKPKKAGLYGIKSSTFGSIGLRRENELYILQFMSICPVQNQHFRTKRHDLRGLRPDETNGDALWHKKPSSPEDHHRDEIAAIRISAKKARLIHAPRLFSYMQAYAL